MSSSPKYALAEIERRFLVAPAAAPDLKGVAYRRIEDRYVIGTRLRLRTMTASDSGLVERKFCKKYPSDDPLGGPITNLYLDAAEHAALAALPARTLAKRRYKLPHDGRFFALDLFEGELDGLMLCEAEAESREAALAIAFPPWCGPEVTADAFFTGGALSATDAATLAARLRELLG
jgi:CYTH domain-containing protein